MSDINSFAGFPREIFHFLADLERNNNREWFGSKHEVVEQRVIAPAQAFVAAFGERARRIYPELIYDIRQNGSGSMFRMSRDTRFSKDKSPYKTNIGLRFWLTQEERAAKRVRLYVHLDKDGMRVYGGEHCQLEHVELTHLRNAIAKDTGMELKSLLRKLEEDGFTTTGEKLSRVPRGYPADHPNADLLRLKSLFMLSPAIAPAVAEGPEIIERCAAYAKALKPLNKWLTKSTGGQT